MISLWLIVDLLVADGDLLVADGDLLVVDGGCFFHRDFTDFFLDYLLIFSAAFIRWLR